CAPLWPQIGALLAGGLQPVALRDLTRGGLGCALAELAGASGCDLVLDEPALPLAPGVEAACALLGLEPLHLANEGRFVAVLPPSQADQALALLAPSGAVLLGVAQRAAGLLPQVRLQTALGSLRVLGPWSGDMLPRICSTSLLLTIPSAEPRGCPPQS
ncbi:MAG: hypothetical protein KGO47_10070, partial [Cyanobacteria bacterium REEB417]|nr:hypothetical protein [Cyanobacteria bacterium REEB417]